MTENEKKGLYRREGNYIYFGMWPNSMKADGVTIFIDMDEHGYLKDGCLDENDFFRGSDGEKYEPVCEPGGYKVEHFKVEPVKWRILEEKDGVALILSEDIVGMKEYGVWAKYDISNARDWMYDTFYARAFTDEQKEIILETTVDNSAETTGFDGNPNACGNTFDFLFLLSHKEAVKYLTAEERAKRPTPYAEAASAYKNDGEWWLRSPTTNKFNAQYVDGDGKIYETGQYVFMSFECLDTVDSTPDVGVVPAMRIKL